LNRLKTFKAERSNEAAEKARAALARATEDESDNIFARVVEAVEAGATIGEICAKLRDELGYGHRLVAA